MGTLGGLVVSSGSNSLRSCKQVRDTYGSIDLDNEDIGGNGWFTEDPEEVARFGGVWRTAEYSPGDIVIFTMHTFHGSSVNQTEYWRLSFDLRFRPMASPVEDLDGKLSPNEQTFSNEGRWSTHRHD